jgi:hypothetical protein
MQLLRVVSNLDEAIAALGGDVELWVTSAGEAEQLLDYGAARARLESAGSPVLIAFGTGWGLAAELCTRAAFRLSPIRSAGPDGYNHLSVRAAAAIIFDRLLAR